MNFNILTYKYVKCMKSCVDLSVIVRPNILGGRKTNMSQHQNNSCHLRGEVKPENITLHSYHHTTLYSIILEIEWTAKINTEPNHVHRNSPSYHEYPSCRL